MSSPAEAGCGSTANVAAKTAKSRKSALQKKFDRPLRIEGGDQEDTSVKRRDAETRDAAPIGRKSEPALPVLKTKANLVAVTRAQALIELNLVGALLTANKSFLKTFGVSLPATVGHLTVVTRVRRPATLH
jgi:hypothetical protein